MVLPGMAKKSDGVNIQDGVLMYPAGHFLDGDPLMLGFDPFGYNYQAHMFKGLYVNVYLGRVGFPPYEGDNDAYLTANPTVVSSWVYTDLWLWRDAKLTMKWNDAWLSNMDREPDGVLDRHYPLPTYIGSGAWITNHQWGYNTDGTKWTYFVKIVAVPANAYRVGPANTGTWYTEDDIEIGPDIWGEFAIIQEVYNDPSTGDHGLDYKSPVRAGLGNW